MTVSNADYLDPDAFSSSIRSEERVEPAIWIGDLAAYNSGILHGKWVTVAPDMTIEDLQAKVNDILEEGQRKYSKETLSLHEEWGIFDFEGFGPIRLDQYTPLQTVLEHVNRMGDNEDKYFAFIDANGVHCADEYDPDESFGPYESPDEFAWNEMDEIVLGPYQTLAEWLESKYMPARFATCIRFDTEDYIDTLRNDGYSFGYHNNKLYVFAPR